MAKATLNLHLLVDEGREADCAAWMQQQLKPDQWKLLAQLSAEIVARWESAAVGQRLVVVQAAGAEAEIAKHLRLRPASPVPE